MTDIWVVAMDRAEQRHEADRYEGRDWLKLTARERAEEILACYSELIAEGYAR